MSRADRDAWRSNDTSFDYGDRAESPVTKPAESLPAPPVEQAAPTGASPKTDSEPVNPKTEKRFQEILAQRAAAQERADALERRLRELEGKTTPAKPDVADSSPSRQFDTLEQWLAKNPTKQPDDYLRAVYADLREQERAEEKQQAEYETFAKTIKESEDAFSDRVIADVGDVKAFAATLPPILSELVPTWNLGTDANGKPIQAKPHNIVAAEIIKSSIPGKLLTYLRDHEKEFMGILNAGGPPDVVKAMGRLEGKLESGQSTAAPKEPPKLTTSAPPPPKVVSQRPAEPADPMRAAIDGGDYLAFKALADAEDAARFARRK